MCAISLATDGFSASIVIIFVLFGSEDIQVSSIISERRGKMSYELRVALRMIWRPCFAFRCGYIFASLDAFSLALSTLLRLSKYITIGKRTGLMLCIYVIVCKCYYVIDWVIKL